MDKTYTILLPNQNQKENTVAETIITILMEEWPLSTRGLFCRLNKYSTRTCSLQATYKAINQLHSNNIIEKNERFYRINENWLLQINKISENLIHKYELNPVTLKEIP